jgi:hypothetical protein
LRGFSNQAKSSQGTGRLFIQEFSGRRSLEVLSLRKDLLPGELESDFSVLFPSRQKSGSSKTALNLASAFVKTHANRGRTNFNRSVHRADAHRSQNC